MSIDFIANNLVDGATITASTENAQFPASNLKKNLRTKVYRSTSNSDNVVFDLGSIEDVDFFGLVDNWADGLGVSTVTLEANATDSWGSPAFSTTITLDTTFGLGFKTFTQQSYRFWRVVMTSTLGYCELANVCIGKKDTVSTNGIEYNWSYRNRDNKKFNTTRYGQKYFDDINQIKRIDRLSYKVMNLTEIDTILNVVDQARTVNPVWVNVDSSANLFNDNDRLNGMYYITGNPRFTNTTAGFYSVSMNVEEVK